MEPWITLLQCLLVQLLLAPTLELEDLGSVLEMTSQNIFLYSGLSGQKSLHSWELAE